MMYRTESTHSDWPIGGFIEGGRICEPAGGGCLTYEICCAVLLSEVSRDKEGPIYVQELLM